MGMWAEDLTVKQPHSSVQSEWYVGVYMFETVPPAEAVSMIIRGWPGPADVVRRGLQQPNGAGVSRRCRHQPQLVA